MIGPHRTVLASDVGCGAAVSELHPHPQQLWRKQLDPLADHWPMPPENVRARIISLANKVVKPDEYTDEALAELHVGEERVTQRLGACIGVTGFANLIVGARRGASLLEHRRVTASLVPPESSREQSSLMPRTHRQADRGRRPLPLAGASGARRADVPAR